MPYSAIITLILQIRKLSIKEVKAMAQSYTANKGSINTHTLYFDKNSPLYRQGLVF